MNGDIDDFLKNLRLRVSATTAYRKGYQIKAFYNYCVKQHLDYWTLQRSDVESYLVSLPCTRAARQQVCCVIREFYDFIKVPQNPAAHITFKPDHQKKLFAVPSQAVIENIIGKLSEENTILALRNRLIVELAYGSGLRRSEMAQLNIEDINFADKTIHISGKGGFERIVPMTQTAAQVLREYLEKRQAYRGALLVSYKGKKMLPYSIYQVLKIKAGIKTHLLRHACATHMLKNGCSVRVIQELFGHKRLTTTQEYTHILKEELRNVINKKHPRSNS